MLPQPGWKSSRQPRGTGMLLEILFPCLPSRFAANLVPGSSRQHAESRVSAAPPELSGPWGAHTAVPKVGITAQEQRLPGAKGFQCRFASPWGSSPRPQLPAPRPRSGESGDVQSLAGAASSPLQGGEKPNHTAENGEGGDGRTDGQMDGWTGIQHRPAMPGSPRGFCFPRWSAAVASLGGAISLSFRGSPETPCSALHPPAPRWLLPQDRVCGPELLGSF